MFRRFDPVSALSLSRRSFSTAICRSDCHATRGYCESPGECRCRLGWAGETCRECQVLPGCQNGYCTKPLECRCKEGWSGILCQTGNALTPCAAMALIPPSYRLSFSSGSAPAHGSRPVLCALQPSARTTATRSAGTAGSPENAGTVRTRR